MLEGGGSGDPPTGFVPEAREGGSDWGFCPLSVCVSVRPDRQNVKNGTFAFFLILSSKVPFWRLGAPKHKKWWILVKISPNWVFWWFGHPKVSKFDKVFHYFSQAAYPRAKSEKLKKKVVLEVKNRKWHLFHHFYHFGQLCDKKVNFLTKTLPAYVS